MARIRTIKPEFYIDEDLCLFDCETHLFAAALLNHCDDEGYFKANPKLLHAQIFPLRELSGSVPVVLKNLEKINYLRLFEGSDGRQYGQVLNFTKHQVINKPTASKIKELEILPEDYGSPPVELPVGKERKGKERNMEQGEYPRATIAGESFIPDDFEPTKDTLTQLAWNKLKPLDSAELLKYISTRQKKHATCANWQKDYIAWVVTQRTIYDKQNKSSYNDSIDQAGEAFINDR